VTVLFSLALALITNWIRVFTLIVLGHATQMQHYLVSVEHYRFGWVLFAAAMIIFFFVARYLPTAAESSDSPAPSNAFHAPNVPVLVAALAALSIGPVWLAMAPQANARSMRSNTPVSVEGWQGPTQTEATDWAPVYEGADSKTMVEYRKASIRAEVFVASYHEQHQGKELIGYDNSMIGPNLSIANLQRLESSGLKLNVQHAMTRDGRRAVIIYYYAIGRAQTTSGRTAQLLYGWHSLFNVPVSEVVGAYAVCKSSCESEQSELISLLTTIRGSRE
jgi:EpsI family protein